MKRGMTLVETLIATAVTALLMVTIGSSFALYKQVNMRTITDSRSGINLSSVKSLIINMTDDEVLKSVGNVYLKINKEDYDKVFGEDDIEHIDDPYAEEEIKYSIVDEEDNEVTINKIDNVITVNNEYICKLPLDYKEKKIFLKKGDDEKVEISFLELNEAIFYKKLSEGQDSISLGSFSYDNENYKGILLYGGNVIYQNLPYENFDVKYKLKDINYYVVESEENSELISFDKLKVETNNSDYGAVNISNPNFETNEVTLKAIRYYSYDIYSNKIKIHDFDHWEGEGVEGSSESTITVSMNGGTYKAIFKDDLRDVEEEEFEGFEEDDSVVSKNARNAQTVIKHVYVVECEFKYNQKDQNEETMSFIADSFEKYEPDIYVKPNDEEGE